MSHSFVCFETVWLWQKHWEELETSLGGVNLECNAAVLLRSIPIFFSAFTGSACCFSGLAK